MHTPLIRSLLCSPVPGLNLPALVAPNDFELMEREAVLDWHPDEGAAALLFTLRLNGVVVILQSELPEVFGKH